MSMLFLTELSGTARHTVKSARPKSEVLEFRLETPTATGGVESREVRFEAARIDGTVQDGDEVLVTGTLSTAGLRARRIRNLSSNSQVVGSGLLSALRRRVLVPDAALLILIVSILLLMLSLGVGRLVEPPVPVKVFGGVASGGAAHPGLSSFERTLLSFGVMQSYVLTPLAIALSAADWLRRQRDVRRNPRA